MGSLGTLNCDSPSKPHAVVIPYPGQGHTTPMMQLSKKLASQGFTITFLNSEFLHEKVVQSHTQSCKTASEECELDIRLESVPLPGLADLGSKRKIDLEDLTEATKRMSGFVGQLLERLSKQQPPVTCIISDALMSTWTQELADKHQIPRIAFFTCNQSFYVFFFHLPLLLARGPIPFAASKRDAYAANDTTKDADNIITGLPGLPPLRPADIPTFVHNGDTTEYMYNHMACQLQDIRKAERVLVNTFYDLESCAIDALSLEVPTYAVGPLLPTGFTGGKNKRSGTSLFLEQDECLQWLDEQPACSVLYVSFGSVARLSVAQFQEIALGLEASRQRFLWVLRPNLIADVSTDPDMLLPEDFLVKTKDRCCLVSWAPQLLVLSHASIGGFLTHCGWNSTLESISNGIPMMGWPYFADQMLNCRLIVDEWKVGMEFRVRDEDGLVGREEVERVVREMMEGKEGQEMRRRALRLKDAARKSILEGGDSYQNIQAFVETSMSSTKDP